MKGELSLMRSHQENRDVSLRLRLDTGRTMTMTMKLADFGLLVTGMSDVPCDLKFRNVQLAEREEVARLLEYVGKDPYTMCQVKGEMLVARTFAEFPRGSEPGIWADGTPLFKPLEVKEPECARTFTDAFGSLKGEEL